MNFKQKTSIFLAMTMMATPIISNAKTIDYTKEYPRHVIFEKADKNLDYKEEPINYVFTVGSYIYTRTDVNKNITTYNPADAKPYIKNSRTMLPLRYVGYAINADVKWDDSNRTAYFTRDGITAAIQIDGNKIVMSDGNVYEMDAKPDNINGRIFVSITNVAKAFGLTHGDTLDGKDQDIEWDAKGRVDTTIYMKKLTSSPKKVAEEDKHPWYRHYRDLDNDKKPNETKEPSKEKEEKPVLKTEAPILNTITAGDKKIKGKAIPNSDITVTLSDGTKLQTKSDDKGNFVFIVPEDKELKKDDIVKAISQEKDKTPSDEVSTKVLEKEDTRKDNEKYPLVKPKKIEVQDINKLTKEEKDQVEKEIKKVNPKAKKIEIGDNSDTVIIYPDNSINKLKQEDTVYERELQHSKSFNLKQRWNEEKDEQYIDIELKDGEKLVDGSKYKLVKKTEGGYTEVNIPVEVNDGNIRIDVRNENIIHNEKYYLETIEEGKEPAYSENPVKIDKETPIEIDEVFMDVEKFNRYQILKGTLKDTDNSIYKAELRNNNNNEVVDIDYELRDDNKTVVFDIKCSPQFSYTLTVYDSLGNKFIKSFEATKQLTLSISDVKAYRSSVVLKSSEDDANVTLTVYDKDGTKVAEATANIANKNTAQIIELIKATDNSKYRLKKGDKVVFQGYVGNDKEFNSNPAHVIVRY